MNWTKGVGGLGMLTLDVAEYRWQKVMKRIGRYFTLWTPLLAAGATLPLVASACFV